MSDETCEDEITCPKCGFVFDCSYECFTVDDCTNNSAEVECEECNASLSVERIVTVEYQTKVAE